MGREFQFCKLKQVLRVDGTDDGSRIVCLSAKSLQSCLTL